MGRGRGAGRTGRRRRARPRFGSGHWVVARRGDLRRGFHNKDGYVASGTRSRARPPGSAAARRMAPREQRGRSGVHRAPAVGRGGTPMIRVLIVEDDFRVAEIHRAYVQRLEGFTVVAEAHTALEAPRLAEESPPDLVLLAVSLPDRSGLEVLLALRAPDHHPPDVIALPADTQAEPAGRPARPERWAGQGGEAAPGSDRPRARSSAMTWTRSRRRDSETGQSSVALPPGSGGSAIHSRSSAFTQYRIVSPRNARRA